MCGSQQTVENSSRDGNTRPPDLPLEKSGCRSGSKLELDIERGTGSKSGKEYIKAVYCHSAYLNLYTEYIMRNAVFYKAQTGIMIAGRNTSNLRHANDTTLMAESKEELKSLVMKVRVRKLA